MKIVFFSLALVACFVPTLTLKVLGVFPVISSSHFAIGSSIIKSLNSAGHEVTVVSPYPLKKPIKNYRDIDTSDLLAEFKKKNSPKPFEFHLKPAVIHFFVSIMGAELAELYLNHLEVQKLLKSDEKFDVCVIEIFMADALLGIADHVGCTLITYTAFNSVSWIDFMTSHQSPYSYVPHPFLSYTDKMSFVERLASTTQFHLENILYRFQHLPKHQKILDKYFPNSKKSMGDLLKSSAIIFVNDHVGSSSPRPYMPNVVEIGGIHVSGSKPLPKDIQEFLDSAKDGAILFSMGSLIQAVQWPVEKREALVKAFGKLKQKVLWKYENETLPNKPDNVMISHWLPQRDILAHPNVKLFITHGGLLGTTEAVVEGVPVLGIPVFGDQKTNMAKAVGRGYGLKVSLEELADENILSAIKELLDNPKYQENAKLISNRFIDRPMSPQQSVVYWTEFAHRHNGAPHLKGASASLNFIEFHLFDVYATLALIASILLYLDYLVLKFVFRKVFKNRKNDGKKLKKK